MKQLDIMRCDFISACSSEDIKKDHRDNTELYLSLLEKGKKEGFFPVLMDREMDYRCNPTRFGLSNSKEDYSRLVDVLINIADSNLSEIWIERLIYNYYLDGIDCREDFDSHMSWLEPPTDEEYQRILSYDRRTDFCFKVKQEEERCGWGYEDDVFALIRVNEPWEIMAHFPIGGFNWCPEPSHQVALAKILYEQYGAIVMYVGYASIEYYLPRELNNIEIMELSRILMIADSDIYEDYHVSARILKGSRSIYMWWD